MNPTKTQAIKAFLSASTHPDLASLYHEGMEIQVNVAQDGGERISTEGFRGRTWHSYQDGSGQVWKSFRIPWKAFSEPEYIDFEIKFDLAEHAEAIGMTGWNWKDKVSKWCGYDFDAISGHSEKHTSKLTPPELEAVKKAACDLPWVTVRKSTSGNGLHLYVFVDNIPTENHTEHAALARSLLGKMSASTGYDFSSKVDACGGVLWVWHRKITEANRGLELIEQGEILKEVPINWADHVPVVQGKRKKNLSKYIKEESVDDFETMTAQRPNVKLDEQHKKLLEYLEEINAQHWWDSDRHMLVCHTHDLKIAHQNLKLRGIFDTLATGKDTPNDHNAFAFALEQPAGAWTVRRYTPGIQESSSWDIDASGFTRCYYNREPTLDVASRSFEGIEDEKGGFQFTTAKRAGETAKILGVNLGLPEELIGRTTELKQHKDGRLVVSVKREPKDLPPKGWREDKGYWKRIFNAKLQQPGDSEILSYDNVVRHLVTAAGNDFGWVLRASNSWREEPYTNVRLALKALTLNDRDINNILGKCVFEGWTVINEPFQEEFPGNRKWNRNAAQYCYVPKKEEPFYYPTWRRILDHCGKGLDSAVAENGWARANTIETGADYLMIWVASLFQYPKEPLPYLFLYSKEERTGKTTFHESLSFLMTHGYMKADISAISSAAFNGELEGAILCAIEEVDLQKSIYAKNRIKDWVTGRKILIHHKGKTPYLIDNTVHFVQTGNESSECPIFPGDTRITAIHVPPLDLIEMIMPNEMKLKLEQEAADFMGALLAVEIPPSNDRLRLPVIDSEIKLQVSESNRTALEVFFDETVYEAPGEKVPYGELYTKFLEWIDPNEVHLWTKIKFGRELPSKYPKGRVMSDGAQFYVGNLSLTATESTNEKKPLILKSGKLL